MTTRFNDSESPWQETYAGYIRGELMEFLGQHGPGANLLLPARAGISPNDAPEDLRFSMADELGDLLWFGTDIASRISVPISQVCLDALRQYAGYTKTPPATFPDLAEAAVAHASDITVPTRLGLRYPNIPSIPGHSSLASNPLYLFIRTTGRLTRALDQGAHDLSPPGATELEPVQDPVRSLGTYFLVLAYIASTRLRIPVNSIVDFNMAKLRHRRLHGKEKDIKFDRSWA